MFKLSWFFFVLLQQSHFLTKEIKIKKKLKSQIFEQTKELLEIGNKPFYISNVCHWHRLNFFQITTTSLRQSLRLHPRFPPQRHPTTRTHPAEATPASAMRLNNNNNKQIFTQRTRQLDHPEMRQFRIRRHFLRASRLIITQCLNATLLVTADSFQHQALPMRQLLESITDIRWHRLLLHQVLYMTVNIRPEFFYLLERFCRVCNG